MPVDSSRAKSVLLVLCGTMLLTASARLQVPFYPVPMTMQTLVVLLLGTAFGFRFGMITVACYLVEGALGLPVFSGTPARGIGISYMMGPTGGYLLGFLFAVALTGYASDKGWFRKIYKTGLVMTAAYLLIYLPGLLWLSRFTGHERLFELGFFPFLPGDFFKLTLAVCLSSVRQFRCS